MTALVIRADARHLPLPDASVDLLVTSPPYYGLRDYRDSDASLTGQIGAEATPGEYIAHLLDCTREWMRVLKPEGSMWINIGDKYAGAPSGPTGATSRIGSERGGRNQHDVTRVRQTFERSGAPNKSLLGLPWMFALRCVYDLGLILRAEVIWAKKNGLPESVNDRARRAHEQFFHFVKQPRYFAAVDEIREPHRMRPQRRPNGHKSRQQLGVLPAQTYSTSQRDDKGVDGHPLGALPGSVWEIATQPLRVPDHLAVDHFAAFPPALVKRIILGWSPPGICTVCGEGRRPVSDRGRAPDRPGRVQDRQRDALLGGHGADGRAGNRYRSAVAVSGYACACPTPDAPTRPALVVDPFGGTGTTSLVADVLGRTGITCDLSHDYGRIACWRTSDPGERARALGVPKPPPVSPMQGDLFAAEEPA